ncbi:MAG: DNA-binding transcriptional MerR regulator [Acidimicrobiales bacterium]|jgi:DNA-binding transcriptional MerR regulator
MDEERTRFQIGEFAELVGLSVPQLRRYDRLQLLSPAGRSEAGYRFYSSGQTGTARVIALLRSLDMPIADIRRILTGVDEDDRQGLIVAHRARLETRLDEVHSLLDAVDAMTKEDETTMDTTTDLSSWLHVLPRLPVSDMDRSIAYYQEVLGFRLAWRTTDGTLAALASGDIELFLLVPWTGDSPIQSRTAYIYVEDPDALCAEYELAGADIIDPVQSRPYGMRDFEVADPDGHRFTLGKGEERLREIASDYGLNPDEITINTTPPHTRR